MGLLHALGAIKSFSQNGVGGLLGLDILDQEILQGPPAELASYPCCQVEGVSYLLDNITISGKAMNGDFVDGARVLIVSPLGYRMIAHVSKVRMKSGSAKMHLDGVSRAAVNRMSWIVMIGDSIAEYNNLTDGTVVECDRSVFVTTSFSHYDISVFSGYTLDGVMIGPDFVEGQEVTMFHDLSRVDATIKSIEVFDKEVNGSLQHRARIKIAFVAAELSGDLTKPDSRITVIPRTKLENPVPLKLKFN